MTIKRVFNNTLSTENINRTDSLKGAIGFFIVFPDSADELEIDFYLQVEVTNTENRLLKVDETYTANTLSLYTIPMELQGSGLNLYGSIIGTFSLFVEVWGIFSYSTLEEIKDQGDRIENILIQNRILQLAEIGNEIAQNTALTILAGSLAPITAGTSLGAITPLQGSNALLTPLLLPSN